jgi:hypothetical protein
MLTREFTLSMPENVISTFLWKSRNLENFREVQNPNRINLIHESNDQNDLK